MVQLVPINTVEFDSYIKQQIRNYAEEKVAAGTWPEGGAQDRSEREVRNLLPQGKDTKNNYIFKVMDESSGTKVGTIWIKAFRDVGIPSAFVYDIIIDSGQRRKGYGRAAMKALEPVVKELGLNRIELHVFGHNKTAINLYETSGFVVTDINMMKEL